ncbi:MAG: radical SAM/Cys-rich domain protein [Phycisphaerae bacterium]|nr:radical SAM/Cys-rich domain protein [Phycisphaerae bacterium]
MENRFDSRLRDAGEQNFNGLSLRTVQINVGLKCNLACHHCHVESSPKRTEEMTWETMQWVLLAAKKARAVSIDITGGAPEMNPHFRRLIDAAVTQGHEVIVRTNLTIMFEDGYGDLPEFYANRHVHLVASLPCYLETNVDRQRGKHVYEESIEIIQRLNALGYGVRAELPLDLVYNPGGPTLPPEQSALEAAYRSELGKRFGIHFTRLYTITNLPIGRFQHDLRRQGYAAKYQELLERTFNQATLAELMCRHQLHVGWDGTIYDCDFNYALKLPASAGHIRDFDPATFLTRRIVTGTHCFGCTAGCGSSCGGSLVAEAVDTAQTAVSVVG